MHGFARRTPAARKLACSAVLAGAILLACGQTDSRPPGKGPTDAKGEPGKADPAKADPGKSDPVKADPETARAEPTEPTVKPDPLPQPPDGPHPFGARDLVALDRLGEHVVSPDGKTVVFVRRVLDHGAGKLRGDLWSAPTAGGTPRRLTEDDAGESNPRFSPDGKTLYFVSSRGGTNQVWRMPAEGGAAEAVTDLPLPVANLQLSPAGDRLAFSMEVFVDCEDLACTKARLDAAERDMASGRTYDRLMVRHWDHFRDGRRSHLFTMPIGGPLGGGTPVDLAKGQDADVPSQPFGGPEEYTFSPDGSTVIYTAKDVGESEAWSTDFDLHAVAADGTGERRVLTDDNPAWDTTPVFSPDGKTLAWLAMSTPGYEADRFRIKVRSWPDGEVTTLAEPWDRSAGSLQFAPDGASLLVTAQHLGQLGVFRVALADGAVTELWAKGNAAAPAFAGEKIVLALDDLGHPADLWLLPAAGGEPTQLTRLNEERLAGVQFGEAEQFTFAGWKGQTVHAYVVRPPGSKEGDRHPVAMLVHGGPQGSFGNHFHYRWNPQTYAGAGYAAVMIDFHGSTGYGQAFTDSIQGDWGGKPLEDLKKGLAAATERYPWIDGERACALGASYGGFMMNWIAGRWPDRFRCLVNHDGVLDQRAMYYSTEELWFPEREHGAPEFQDPKAYAESDPVRFVNEWRTPMLVIHGSMDYRVPETQGLSTFTALQRRSIPSRYVSFPDENHWVVAPANSLQWHAEVEAWLGRWLAEGGSAKAP
jgi:dipeptidyl aminopeptidase/acylaminoacyl peptidase